MQMPQEKSTLLYSDMQGEVIPFVIGDTSIIIDIVRSKIYSQPINTVVCEYISNARDSCVEAGKNSSNIEVTLPTGLNPIFSVRDYGVGMDEKRIHEVFVQYGVSTKRATNNQVGYFGIGAKSGFAYTDSFIVESFYNGIHREYLADIGASKEGKLRLLKETSTDEGNGVRIKIPVQYSDFQKFENAYIRTTCLWKKKPTVNNKVNYPELRHDFGHIKIFSVNVSFNAPFDRAIYLDANGIPFKADVNGSDVIDMLNGICLNSGGFIAIKVDPSKLQIAASRENFANKKYATDRINEAYKWLAEYVKKSFEEAKYSDYVKVYSELSAITRVVPELFKGKPFSFMRDFKGKISISLNGDGYFYCLLYKQSYKSSVKLTLHLKNVEIFLSRSEAKHNGKMNLLPEVLPLTKKALVNAKRESSNNKFVFFKNQLSDEMYAVMAEILGATRYIEDVYGHLKIEVDSSVPKLQKDKSIITVQKLKGSISGNKTIRDVYSQTIEKILEFYKLVIYCDTCHLDFLTGIVHNPLAMCMVYASPSNAKKLKDLNHPCVISIDSFPEYIKQKPEDLQVLMDIHACRAYRQVNAFISCTKGKIQTSSFDVNKIVSMINKCNEYSHKVGRWDNFLPMIPLQSDLVSFAEKYPLVEHIPTYKMSDKNILHCNQYIKSIDKGISND